MPAAPRPSAITVAGSGAPWSPSSPWCLACASAGAPRMLAKAMIETMPTRLRMGPPEDTAGYLARLSLARLLGAVASDVGADRLSFLEFALYDIARSVGRRGA